MLRCEQDDRLAGEQREHELEAKSNCMESRDHAAEQDWSDVYKSTGVGSKNASIPMLSGQLK
jgi:hypothetical protein